MRPPLVLLFAALAVFCQAQTPLPDGAYRVGNGVTAPTVLSKTDPEYSEEARIAKLSGAVLLNLIVGEDGKVREVHADKPLGLGLDEKVIEAVRSWQFRPGKKDGVPVPVSVTFESNFRLAHGRGDHGGLWRGQHSNLPKGRPGRFLE
jgi:TonB family protein